MQQNVKIRKMLNQIKMQKKINNKIKKNKFPKSNKRE